MPGKKKTTPSCCTTNALRPAARLACRRQPLGPSPAPLPAQLRSSSRAYRGPAVTATRGRRICGAPRAHHDGRTTIVRGSSSRSPDQLQQQKGQGPWWRSEPSCGGHEGCGKRLVGLMAAAAVLFGGLGAITPVDPAFAADALATCGLAASSRNAGTALHNQSDRTARSSRWHSSSLYATLRVKTKVLSDAISRLCQLQVVVDPLDTVVCALVCRQRELLRCLGDGNCAANIACLQACNGLLMKTECQVRTSSVTQRLG